MINLTIPFIKHEDDKSYQVVPPKSSTVKEFS